MKWKSKKRKVILSAFWLATLSLMCLHLPLSLSLYMNCYHWRVFSELQTWIYHDVLTKLSMAQMSYIHVLKCTIFIHRLNVSAIPFFSTLVGKKGTFYWQPIALATSICQENLFHHKNCALANVCFMTIMLIICEMFTPSYHRPKRYSDAEWDGDQIFYDISISNLQAQIIKIIRVWYYYRLKLLVDPKENDEIKKEYQKVFFCFTDLYG